MARAAFFRPLATIFGSPWSWQALCSSFDVPLRAVRVSAVALPLAVLYARPVGRLVAEWLSSPDASYGLVLLAAALWIAWERRDAVVIDRLSSPVIGFVLLAFGLALYVAGSIAADVFLLRESMVVVLAGTLAFFAGGASLALVGAPLVFLAAAIPPPALLVNTITLPMQLVASQFAERVLALGGVPVYRDGNLLILPGATLEVAEACSGLRSVVSLGAIALLLAWATTGTAWRRVALVAAAIPIAIVMNGFRIAATGAATLQWGPAAAAGAWHTATGWVTFVVSTAVLLFVERRWVR